MNMNINITQFTPDIKPVVRPNSNLKAFVTWIFETSEGQLKITGGTIKLKTFGESKTELLSYDGPAYKGGFKYYTVFFLNNKSLFKQLCEETIRLYCEMTGETYTPSSPNEEIDIDEIDRALSGKETQ